jgi:DNA polymerase III epsilon subunit
MREIVFDTETTGLNPAGGDRMVEIGCVEIFNRVETGRHFHAYFNPERDMPFEAQEVHGLSNLFLSDKPRFAEKAEELLDFIEDSPLVAHPRPLEDASKLNRGRCRHHHDLVELLLPTRFEQEWDFEDQRR